MTALYIALFLQYGFKIPFIFSLAFAGIELLLCIFMIERRSCPDDWLENNKGIDNNDNNYGSSNISATESTVTTIEVKDVNFESYICNTDCVNSNKKETRTTKVVDVYAEEEKLSSTVGSSAHDDKSEATTARDITTFELLRSPRIWTLILVNFCSGWAVVIFEVRFY